MLVLTEGIFDSELSKNNELLQLQKIIISGKISLNTDNLVLGVPV